jgi:uncharacterized protein YjeT (DUF2065 family)
MKLFLIGLGLFFIFEGMPYFAFPERMKEMLAQIQELPPKYLRVIGLISMIIGLFICYLVQKTGFADAWRF